jgi:hypothetical protein
MRTHLMAVAAATVLIALARPAAQAPAPTTAEIVARATKYVDAYVEAFSALVSEEKQVQTLTRPDGRVRKTRAITSDFLLVKARLGWPEAYRDVIEVDGRKIGDRQDRLRKLFLEHPKDAQQLVDAIKQESGRYNIGTPRTGNSPLAPIIFLTSRIAPGVRFEGSAAKLTFQEVRRPTVLSRNGVGNMPSQGSFEIEPETGRVLSAEFSADNTESLLPKDRVSASFTVRYAIDPKLDLSVPVEVTERYTHPLQPDADVLTMHATYSAFRRFQVTTDEQIKK